MKESIGSTQLYIIVIVMVVLFTGLVAFAMNRANAFAVKDQIVSIIEANDGYEISVYKPSTHDDIKVLDGIIKAISEKHYDQKGTCEKEIERFGNKNVAMYNRDGTRAYNDPAFCIVKSKVTSGDVTRYYYRVVIFYSLDIPVLRALLTFRDIGETKILNK